MTLRIELRHDENILGTKLYILDDRDDRLFVAEPIELTFSEVDMTQELLPTMRFDRRSGERFLSSFADALARLGFRADELKAKDGELGALRYHLEDMRELVFKKMRHGK